MPGRRVPQPAEDPAVFPINPVPERAGNSSALRLCYRAALNPKSTSPESRPFVFGDKVSSFSGFEAGDFFENGAGVLGRSHQHSYGVKNTLEL